MIDLKAIWTTYMAEDGVHIIGMEGPPPADCIVLFIHKDSKAEAFKALGIYEEKENG